MTEVRLMIKPESWTRPHRIEASRQATELGKGLLMELHSSHTEFYATDSVPVGQVEVWAPPGYKQHPVYVTTLDSASDTWAPEGWEDDDE